MPSIVTYGFEDPLATIEMDDGKVNALSIEMLGQLNAALDRAESDAAVVVLMGRSGRFSGGFDLNALRAGGQPAIDMLRAGFELSERLLSFPTPVVIACTGHAIAMGLFLLLSGDYRVGASDSYKLTANEVAIGLAMPQSAVEICRQRLTPAAFNRAVILAEVFTPGDAIEAGILDRLVQPSDLRETALQIGRDLAKLDMAAHVATKRRARAPSLTALRSAIESDDAAMRGQAQST
jgi:enoyl-CoA hydratase